MTQGSLDEPGDGTGPCATWPSLAAALIPIIGARGFAALYRRSVLLCVDDFPWLEDCVGAKPGAVDFNVLRAVLAAQSNHDAAAANDQLLGALREVLTSLIGPALTARLLTAAIGTH